MEDRLLQDPKAVKRTVEDVVMHLATACCLLPFLLFQRGIGRHALNPGRVGVGIIVFATVIGHNCGTRQEAQVALAVFWALPVLYLLRRLRCNRLAYTSWSEGVFGPAVRLAARLRIGYPAAVGLFVFLMWAAAVLVRADWPGLAAFLALSAGGVVLREGILAAWRRRIAEECRDAEAMATTFRPEATAPRPQAQTPARVKVPRARGGDPWV
ncbi:MAG: hypothetical protein K2X87_13385 [Gemmataceae bacterium]|nr:hypothetical protein [Gemmataceae bacterium]